MDRGRAAGALLALAACIVCSAAAPTAGNQTALDLYDGPSEGCYYNFQHYGEGDRIMTNEPCLNCTCHNRMLMCYLRVCPFTKPIGQDCTVEKRADQCCPIVTCPDVPVDLLTSTSTTSPAEYGATGLGKHDKYGCSINDRYFPEGSKVPPSPNKPCEHCYCIRNMTTCVMQECTLHVDGCTPIYHKDVCCPVRYSCDHPEDEIPLLDDMTTTVRPTPGFLLTTTTIAPVTQASQDCVHDERIFSDGALIKTEKACEHCYCMKGDIVCVVQECGTPMENEGKNCTSITPREGQCCPDTYICEGDDITTEFKAEYTTESISELTTKPPRRVDVEGSGYRNEDEPAYTEPSPFSEPEIEGSGDIQHMITPTAIPEKETSIIIDETEEPHIQEQSTPKMPSFEDTNIETTEPDRGQNTVPIEDETSEPFIPVQTTVSTEPKVTEPAAVEEEKETKEHDHLTTVSDFSSTLQDDSVVKDDQNTITTEETLKKEDKNIVSPETSSPTIADKLVTETLSEETYTISPHITSTESITSSDNNEFKSTSPPEYSEVTIKELTTEAALDVTTIRAVTTPEKEPIDIDAQKGQEITTTSIPIIELPEITSTINPLENEIQEDITTTLSPARIPGEGDCLLDGVTYRNESVVPSSNNCHTSCKCISSIIKCEPIICSPPPNYMDNCQPVFDTPESCCPAYVCDQVGETMPPQPHSQVSETEHPVSSPTVECHGDECQVNADKEKLPEECKTENCLTESLNKPEQSDCGSNGCDSQIPTDSQKTPENCIDGNCTSTVTCTKGQCQTPEIKDEVACNDENGCQKLPVVPCEGDNCIVTPSKNSSSQSCDGNSKECKSPDTTTPLCEGESCINKNCESGECDTEIKLTPPPIDSKDCKEGDECRQPIESEVEKECKDEYCRRKETPDVDTKPLVNCEDSTCKPLSPLEPSKETTEAQQFEQTSKINIEPSTTESDEATKPTAFIIPEAHDLSTLLPNTDITISQESGVTHEQTTTSLEYIQTESPKLSTASDEISHTESPEIETQQMTTKAELAQSENEPSVTEIYKEPYTIPESDLTSELPQDLITEIDNTIITKYESSTENVRTESPESLTTKLNEPTDIKIEFVTKSTSSSDIVNEESNTELPKATTESFDLDTEAPKPLEESQIYAEVTESPITGSEVMEEHKDYTQVPLEADGKKETEQYDKHTEPSITKEQEPLTKAPEVVESENTTKKPADDQEIDTKVPDVSIASITSDTIETTVSAINMKSTEKETESHITTESYNLSSEDSTAKGFEDMAKTTESPELFENKVTEYSITDSTKLSEESDQTKSPGDYTNESIHPITDSSETGYTKLSDTPKDQYDSSDKQEFSTEEQKPIQSEVQEPTTSLPEVMKHPVSEAATEIPEMYVTQSSATIPEAPTEVNTEYHQDTQTENPEDVTESNISDDLGTHTSNEPSTESQNIATDIPNIAVTGSDTMYTSKPDTHEENIVDKSTSKHQEEISTQLPDVTSHLLYTNVPELSTNIPVQDVPSKQEEIATVLPDTDVEDYDLTVIKPSNIPEIQEVSSKEPAEDTTDEINITTSIPQVATDSDFATQEPEIHEIPLEVTTKQHAEQTDLDFVTVTESTEMHTNAVESYSTHSYEEKPEIDIGSHESNDETPTNLPKTPEVEITTVHTKIPESVQVTQISPESPTEVTTIKQEEIKPDITSGGDLEYSVPTTLYDSGHESTETSVTQDDSIVDNAVSELDETQTLSPESPVTEDNISKMPVLSTEEKISTDSPVTEPHDYVTPEKEYNTELPEQPLYEDVSRTPETSDSEKFTTETPESFVTVNLVSETPVDSPKEPAESSQSDKDISSTDVPSYPKKDESIEPENSISSESPLPQKEMSVIPETSTLEAYQPTSNEVTTEAHEKVETNNLVTETSFTEDSTAVEPHELEKVPSYIPTTEKQQAEIETEAPVTEENSLKPSEPENDGTHSPDLENEIKSPESPEVSEPEIEDYTKKPEDNFDHFTIEEGTLTETPEIFTEKPEAESQHPESQTAVPHEENFKPTEISVLKDVDKTELPLSHVPELTETVTKMPEELVTDPPVTLIGPTEMIEKEIMQTTVDLETDYPKISTSQPETHLDEQKVETKLPELESVTQSYAIEKEEQPTTQKPELVAIDSLTTVEQTETESEEVQKASTVSNYPVNEQEAVTEISSSIYTKDTSDKPTSNDIQPDSSGVPETSTKPQDFDDTHSTVSLQEMETEQPIQNEINSVTTHLQDSSTKTPEKDIHVSTTERQEILPTESGESQKISTYTSEKIEPSTADVFTQEASKSVYERVETTPSSINEFGQTESVVDEITTNLPEEIKPHKPEDSSITSTDEQVEDEKVTETSDMKVIDKDEETSTPFNQYSSPDVLSTTLPTEQPSLPETQEKETLPISSTDEGDTKHETNDENKEISTNVPVYQESDQATPSEDEAPSLSQTENLLETEKDQNTEKRTEQPEKAEVLPDTAVSEEELIPTTAKVTTSKSEDEVTTQSPTTSDKFTKPEEKPIETSSSTATPEVPKPGFNDMQPTDEITSPEEESHFPPGPTSGYDPEPEDYVEEDQPFGPGTCRYGGKVYVSAQQIPRDDPCDFCFCFRSDIICLQQSCPPPIHGCHEEPIQGFCCPRYECPVSMATTLNVTTTTTTTTTTLPPHFLPHAYKGAAQRRGCQIKGHTYKVGEVVRASSGPCLHCTCGGDGQMKCDPKVCTPEPMLRQMIAAAVSAKRRR